MAATSVGLASGEDICGCGPERSGVFVSQSVAVHQTILYSPGATPPETRPAPTLDVVAGTPGVVGECGFDVVRSEHAFQMVLNIGNGKRLIDRAGIAEAFNMIWERHAGSVAPILSEVNPVY